MDTAKCEKCNSEDWIKLAQTDPPGGMMRVIDLKCGKCDHEVRIEVIYTKDDHEQKH